MDELMSKYFLVYFILLWCMVSFIISLLGGWMALAGQYRKPKDKRFNGKMILLPSVSMRLLGSYSNCVYVGLDKEGIFLSVMFLFRVGHPPLFIPWTDITAEKCKLAIVLDGIKLMFAQVPETHLAITQKSAEKINLYYHIKNIPPPTAVEKKKFTFQKLGYIGIAWLIAAAFFSYLIIRSEKMNEYYKMVKHGDQVEGIITGKEPSPSRVLMYEFNVLGSVYSDKEYVDSYDENPERYNDGKSITVYYDTTNPANNSLKMPRQELISSLQLLAFILFVFVPIPLLIVFFFGGI